MTKIKKNLIIITMLVTILLSSGCVDRYGLKEEQIHILEEHDIVFTLMGSWRQTFNENENIDIQFTDKNSYISVIAYKKNTLIKEQTPESIYEFHKNDIISKRSDVGEETEQHIRRVDNKVIKSEFFVGTIENIQSCYYLNLVDFGKESNEFAIVLFTAKPDYGIKKIAEWDKILDDLKLKSDLDEEIIQKIEKEHQDENK